MFLSVFIGVHLWFAPAFLAAAEQATLTSSDVPWRLVDRHTVLIVRIDLRSITGESIRSATNALLGSSIAAAEPWLERADDWLGRLQVAGADRIYLGLGAPWDAEGEEIDPPSWLALHHAPGAADKVADTVNQFALQLALKVNVRISDGGWITVTGSRPIEPGMPAQQQTLLNLALAQARGGGVSAALALPQGMRRELARMLGEFGELNAEPLRTIFKRSSGAAEHWQFATAGLWLGETPAARVELIFDDPQGPIELDLAVNLLRELLRQMIVLIGEERDAERSLRRSLLAAAHGVCRIRYADRSALWESGIEHASLLRPVLLEWFSRLGPPQPLEPR